MSPNTRRGGPPDIAISPGSPRRRIHPTFMETLRRDLGRRDWVKGERATINEIFTSLRSQAQAEGFPHVPKPSEREEAGDVPGADEATRAEAAGLRALREARLDGVARMVDERPEALEPGEADVLPLLIFEAAVHGLRPHAGHERALPSHVARIQREREAAGLAAAPAAVAPAAPRPDAGLAAAHSRIDELHGRMDAMGDQLGQILAAVKASK